MARQIKVTPDTIKLAAEIAALRFLVRELIVITFGRMPDGLRKFDNYIKSVDGVTSGIVMKTDDPALSDGISAEFSESVSDTLKEARAALAKQLKRAQKS